MSPRTQSIPAESFLRQPCESWLSGHDVHWVQGMRASRDTEHPYEPVRVVSVDDDGWFEVETADGRYRVWHHDPHRLAYALTRTNTGRVNLRWSILILDGERPLSIHTNAETEPTPCVHEPPQGSPDEQLRTHGGFSLRLGDTLDEPNADSPSLQYDPGSLPADLDDETVKHLYEAARDRVLTGRGPSTVRVLEARMAELIRKYPALNGPDLDTYRRVRCHRSAEQPGDADASAS